MMKSNNARLLARCPCPIAPNWLLLGLLALEGLLLMSEQGHWFAFDARKGWTVLIAVAGVGVAIVLFSILLALCLLFRWRFQFGLRWLLLVVVAIAVPCSWLAIRMREAQIQRDAVEALREMGCTMECVRLGDNAEPRRLSRLLDQVVDPATLPRPSVWDRLLGVEFFEDVVSVDNSMNICTSVESVLTDTGMEKLQGLPQLRALRIDCNGVGGNGGVTDAGLKRISGLLSLQRLTLNCGRQITDAGLESLRGLSQLQRLELYEARRITNVGLISIGELRQLRELVVLDSPITDTGLKHLKGLTQLQSLILQNTNVTDAGVKMLQEALPQCEIHRRGGTDGR